MRCLIRTRLTTEEKQWVGSVREKYAQSLFRSLYICLKKRKPEQARQEALSIVDTVMLQLVEDVLAHKKDWHSKKKTPAQWLWTEASRLAGEFVEEAVELICPPELSEPEELEEEPKPPPEQTKRVKLNAEEQAWISNLYTEYAETMLAHVVKRFQQEGFSYEQAHEEAFEAVQLTFEKTIRYIMKHENWMRLSSDKEAINRFLWAMLSNQAGYTTPFRVSHHYTSGILLKLKRKKKREIPILQETEKNEYRVFRDGVSESRLSGVRPTAIEQKAADSGYEDLQQRADYVEKLLEQEPPFSQLLYNLYYNKRLTTEDMAVALGINAATLRKRFSRFNQKLKKKLLEKFPDPKKQKGFKKRR